MDSVIDDTKFEVMLKLKLDATCNNVFMHYY